MKKFLAVAILVIAVASPAAAQMHGQGPTEVALRVEAGRLLVPVQAADGTIFEFMVSTGTPPTVLSQSTADALGEQALTIGGIPLDMAEVVTVPDEQLTSDGLAMDGSFAVPTLRIVSLEIERTSPFSIRRIISRIASFDHALARRLVGTPSWSRASAMGRSDFPLSAPHDALHSTR